VRGLRDPDARPPAANWAAALAAEGRRLRTCGANANHWFAHGLRACPWCRMSPDPFPVVPAAGRQVAVPGAGGRVPEAARVEQVRAYARVALADGAVTDAELAYLRKAGGEIGLRVAVVDRVVDEECRRAGSRPAPPSSSVGSASHRSGIRASMPSARSILRAARDRQMRSAWKAATPVIVGSALVGALAPVVAPFAAAIAGLPALATIADARAARGWRTRARLPLRFAVHAYNALGHAARLFVPLAAIGAAASAVPHVRHDWLARGLGSFAVVALVSLTIGRLPFGSDRSASSIRSGRDLVWRMLVGDSARARRPAYVLWALCLAAALALGAHVVLWWPLSAR